MGALLSVVVGCVERVHPDVDTPRRNPTASWSSLLQRSVPNGRLQPALIEPDREVLERYLAWSAEHGPEMDLMRESQEDRRMSDTINANNAAVIHGILRHLDDPSKPSPEGGLEGAFFRRQSWRIDGEWMTLHTMSVQQVVARYQEPLAWVTLYTGLEGGPAAHWWHSKDLQELMERALHDWLDEEDAVMRQEGDGYAISSYLWDRRRDFTDWSDAATLCAYLAPYAEGLRQKWLEENAESCEVPVFPMDTSLALAPRSQAPVPVQPTRSKTPEEGPTIGRPGQRSRPTVSSPDPATIDP